MKWKTFGIGYVLALALLLFGQQHPPAPQSPTFSGIADLTHAISTNVPNPVPSKLAFRNTNVAFVEQSGYLARGIALPRYFATQIEAPSRFAPSLWTVDQIPSQRLTAPLAIMDVSSKSSRNSDYRISVEDVAEWEQVNGQIPQGAVVIARTGWESRWPFARDYRNTDSKGVTHFPGFSRETARFLVEGRNIVGLGTDAPSVIPGLEADKTANEFTLQHSVYHLDSVAHLDRAPAAGAWIVVAPARMEGRSSG